MTTCERATKRAKTKAASPAITSLLNPTFDEKNFAKAKVHAKMCFRCPVTIDNVFRAPALEHVEVFYESRKKSTEKSFHQLSNTETLAWVESFMDNKTLMGFIIYAMLFPKLLHTRFKLNADTYHWDGSARSVFKGLPFFSNREFSMIHSKRREIGSSFVYSSCSMALSLLWFATAVLARPCCLESIAGINRETKRSPILSWTTQRSWGQHRFILRQLLVILAR
ncbi:unnamed protein product [Ectocarpus sp. CCAP 1310/34]|nr:unnamed protein product [Ectocarpus sp. CCAP 1310/34]